MGMHREYAVVCDACGERHDWAEMYADDAKRSAERDGWKISWGSNDATCHECLNEEE